MPSRTHMSLKGKKYWDILNIKLGRRKDDRDTISGLARGPNPINPPGRNFGTQIPLWDTILGQYPQPLALALALALRNGLE